MPTPHPRPWRKDSIFGDGPRGPLDREQRARFRFLLTAHRRVRRLTPLAELIGNALVKRLSVGGQCDPAHDTIAVDVGCCSRTVRRALDALKALGLVIWQRRILRDGWRVSQTSNAYLLVPLAGANPPEIRARRCGGQIGRETLKRCFLPMQQVASDPDRAAAKAALGLIAASRQARLLNNGRMG